MLRYRRGHVSTVQICHAVKISSFLPDAFESMLQRNNHVRYMGQRISQYCYLFIITTFLWSPSCRGIAISNREALALGGGWSRYFQATAKEGSESRPWSLTAPRTLFLDPTLTPVFPSKSHLKSPPRLRFVYPSAA